MAKRQPITIGDQSFPTKKALHEYVLKILWGSDFGATLNGKDQGFILGLLQRHPRAGQKIGCGIGHFRIGKDHRRNYPYFIAVRTDGTETDFSLMQCITPRNERTNFHLACRTAVIGQIVAFREDSFGNQTEIPCAISGTPVRKERCHVDHAYPMTFDHIVEDYIRDHKLDVKKVPVDGDGDGEKKKWFRHLEESERFAEYHREKAVLRITTEKDNLTQPRHKRKLPSVSDLLAQ